MSLVLMTGFAPLDAPHLELEYCLGELARAVLARDQDEARGRAVLLVEQFREHFAEEEELMRAAGWSLLARHCESHARMLDWARRVERDIATNGVSDDHETWALIALPEVFRVHLMRSDFGFAKFSLGVARDPGAPVTTPAPLARVDRSRAWARAPQGRGRRPPRSDVASTIPHLLGLHWRT